MSPALTGCGWASLGRITVTGGGRLVLTQGRTDQLVFFAFDLLFVGGEATASLPLVERKAKLKRLFRNKIDGLLYSEHVAGDGPRFRAHDLRASANATIPNKAWPNAGALGCVKY